MRSWRGWSWDDGNFGGSGLEPLVRHIQTLTPGAITELALLCWLGRGDASIELLRPHAEHTYSPTLPYYLADKPLLGEYLRTGINKLNSKLS